MSSKLSLLERIRRRVKMTQGAHDRPVRERLSREERRIRRAEHRAHQRAERLENEKTRIVLQERIGGFAWGYIFYPLAVVACMVGVMFGGLWGWSSWASHLAEQGDLKRAQTHFEQQLAWFSWWPESWVPRYNLGTVLTGEGQLKRGETMFRESLKHVPLTYKNTQGYMDALAPACLVRVNLSVNLELQGDSVVNDSPDKAHKLYEEAAQTSQPCSAGKAIDPSELLRDDKSKDRDKSDKHGTSGKRDSSSKDGSKNSDDSRPDGGSQNIENIDAPGPHERLSDSPRARRIQVHKIYLRQLDKAKQTDKTEDKEEQDSKGQNTDTQHQDADSQSGGSSNSGADKHSGGGDSQEGSADKSSQASRSAEHKRADRRENNEERERQQRLDRKNQHNSSGGKTGGQAGEGSDDGSNFGDGDLPEDSDGTGRDGHGGRGGHGTQGDRW